MWVVSSHEYVYEDMLYFRFRKHEMAVGIDKDFLGGITACHHCGDPESMRIRTRIVCADADNVPASQKLIKAVQKYLDIRLPSVEPVCCDCYHIALDQLLNEG